MTRLINAAIDTCIGVLRRSTRGEITALVLGSYITGVLATAGGLVLAGIKIGRKTPCRTR